MCLQLTITSGIRTTSKLLLMDKWMPLNDYKLYKIASQIAEQTEIETAGKAIVKV